MPNEKLERPRSNRIRALCAHNNPGAYSAPPELSRPLQALVRRAIPDTECQSFFNELADTGV
jgi:hypothetical protein